MDTSTIWNYFKKTIKQINAKYNCNLKVLSLHQLRHTHATILFGSGINAKIIQERLGHKEVSMTLDVYSHAVPTLQKSLLDVIKKIKI